MFHSYFHETYVKYPFIRILVWNEIVTNQSLSKSPIFEFSRNWSRIYGLEFSTLTEKEKMKIGPLKSKPNTTEIKPVKVSKITKKEKVLQVVKKTKTSMTTKTHEKNKTYRV